MNKSFAEFIVNVLALRGIPAHIVWCNVSQSKSPKKYNVSFDNSDFVITALTKIEEIERYV